MQPIAVTLKIFITEREREREGERERAREREREREKYSLQTTCAYQILVVEVHGKTKRPGIEGLAGSKVVRKR